MTAFEIILFFVIIPVFFAFLGFPIGAYVYLFGRQKGNVIDLKTEKSSFNFENCNKSEKYDINLVEITSFDKIRLVGEYHDQGAKKTVIFMHGYHSNPRRDFTVTAERFFAEGYNVLCCYQRAHSVSGGKTVCCGQKEQFDILSWVNWVSDKVDDIVVYGLSMGGASVGFASNKIKNPKVKSLIIDCAFTSYYEVMTYGDKSEKKSFLAKLMFLFATKFFCVFLKLKGIDIKKKVGDSLKDNKIPTIFITGEKDKTTPVCFVEENYNVNGSEKMLIIVDGAGHGKAFPRATEEEKKKIFAFLNGEKGEKNE